jgi:hypothetical protein
MLKLPPPCEELGMLKWHHAPSGGGDVDIALHCNTHFSPLYISRARPGLKFVLGKKLLSRVCHVCIIQLATFSVRAFMLRFL